MPAPKKMNRKQSVNKKKNPSPLRRQKRNSHAASSARTKCRMRHHINLLQSAAAGKASSKSSQISEIASDERARNDNDATQCRLRWIPPETASDDYSIQPRPEGVGTAGVRRIRCGCPGRRWRPRRHMGGDQRGGTGRARGPCGQGILRNLRRHRRGRNRRLVCRSGSCAARGRDGQSREAGWPSAGPPLDGARARSHL